MREKGNKRDGRSNGGEVDRGRERDGGREQMKRERVTERVRRGNHDCIR